MYHKPEPIGPRERRRQLHFQRTFARNVLEATALAAARGEAPGPSLLRSFAALEKATGDAVKPATRILLGMKAQHVDRWLEPVARPRNVRGTSADTHRERSRTVQNVADA